MIRFDHPNGAKTVAKDASGALLYWYGALTPPKPPKQPLEKLTVYVGRYRHPTEGQEFLDLCVGATERILNRAPDILENISYAEQCRRFLLWLEKNKLVLNLTHDGELDPPANRK